MISNFSFLHEKFPALENLGALAEQYCFSDPNSCLIKLGMLGETIVNLIFSYDRIELPQDNNAASRISLLFREGYIDRELSGILHTLRKLRNDAVHSNGGTTDECKAVIETAFSLCEWFMQTYGDWDYKHHKFVMPISTPFSQSDKEEEEKKEQELIKEAQKAAETSLQIDLTARKQQAQKAASQRIKPEAETRILIDEQLRKIGWEADTPNLRYSKGTRPQKGHNMAIAEWPTDSTVGDRGYADYAFFIGEKLVAMVEAKASHVDIPSVIDYQCKDYSRNVRAADEKYVINTWGRNKAPFTFATNGRPYLEAYKQKSGIWFLDLREPSNAPKALRGWMSPSGISFLLEQDIEKAEQKLLATSYEVLQDPNGLNLHDYQVDAIKAVEEALRKGQKDILIAMATGTGKTRTALGLIYRFLETDRFHRILFLVDRNSLGDQANDKFSEVKIKDLKSLNEIYDVKTIADKDTESTTRLQIATVQSMVKRILYNEGDTMPAVTDYDLVIVDEAHRGYILDKEMGEDELLYRDQLDYQSKYRSVIEYFDSVKIALTATPALHTTNIFGTPVFNYTYREAVIEGYLVDHDAPHNLKTKISEEGIHYTHGDKIAIYNTKTGELMNGEVIEDELDFDIDDLNKKIINEPTTRKILEEIADYIDPDHPWETGKTLIYAVNDAHADTIVSILKEIFSERGVDNDAIMKITGSVAGGNKKKIREAIKKFENDTFPSVVVTVDLLTTGVDVPMITSLVFMRRVKSRILFEQMLGRATRQCPEIHKTHFEIFDPVRIYEDLKDFSTMKPVVTDPGATFTQLLDGLAVIEEEEKVKWQIDQIVAKLQRKKKKLDDETLEQFTDLTGGKNPDEVIMEVEHADPETARQRLLTYEEAFRLLQEKKLQQDRYVVISDEKDEVIEHTRGYGSGQKPEDYLDSFAAFIRDNVNEIASLNIVCTRPKELTRESLKKLRLRLDREGYTLQQLNTAISELTNEEMTADIISLIRRYGIGSELISHEERIKRAVDKLRRAHSFTQQEKSWLSRIEKYLIEESVLNVDVFNEDMRFRNAGGFDRINKAFQGNLKEVIMELNEYLYDDGGHVA